MYSDFFEIIAICKLQGFHKWKRNVNHIWQVLLYARRLFYKIEVTNPLNIEAAEHFRNDKEGFRNKVRDWVNNYAKR